MMYLELFENKYPILSSGFSLQNSVGAEGKHVTQRCTCQIDNRELLNKIIASPSLIKAKVYEGEKIIFTGVIRPYISAEIEYKRVKPISIEVVDYTELLHIKVYEKLSEELGDSEGIVFSDEWNGIKICDPSNPSNSLVHKICTLANISISSAPSIDFTLHRFTLEAGMYLDSILSKILYEYIYDYTFTANGSLVVFSTSPELEPQEDITSLINSLSISRSDTKKDGCVVTFPKYETKDRIKIYSWERSFINWLNFLSYDGNWMDRDEETVNWDLSSLNDKKEIQLSSFTSDTWTSGSIWGANTSCSLKDCNQKNGKVTFKGGSWATLGRISYGYNIYANASYLVSDKETIGYAGTNSENYSSTFIQERDAALNLAKAIAIRIKDGGVTYSFESFTKLNAGSVYKIKESSVSGISSKVRIISREVKDDTGLYKYKAESISNIEYSTPDIDNSKPDEPENTNEADFFDLRASKASWLAEEENGKIFIDAYGEAFTRYGASCGWEFNGEVVDGEPTSLILEKDDLKVGMNFVKAVIVVNGKRYERQISLTLVQASSYSEFEYAITDTLDPPDVLETYFKFGDYYITYDGYKIVVDNTWTKEQPIPLEGQFIWMRMKNSDGKWVSIRMTGDPGEAAKDWSIYFDPVSYVNSARRQENIVITINVDFMNIPEPHLLSYKLIGSPEGCLLEDNVITILPGNSPKKITAEVTLAGTYGGVKKLTIYGTEEKDSTPLYLGGTDVIPPNITKYGAFLNGDWCFYLGSDTDKYKYGHVYEKNGENWTETVSMQKLLAVQDDAKALQEQNIFAKVIFTQALLTVDASVTGSFLFQNDTNGKRASLEISANKGLDMKYGDIPTGNDNRPSVFKSDFKTGRIFLGDPDNNGVGARSGFVYEPSNGSIKGPLGLIEFSNNGLINGNPIFGEEFSDGVFQSIKSYTKIGVEIDLFKHSEEEVYNIVDNLWTSKISKKMNTQLSPYYTLGYAFGNIVSDECANIFSLQLRRIKGITLNTVPYHILRRLVSKDNSGNELTEYVLIDVLCDSNNLGGLTTTTRFLATKEVSSNGEIYYRSYLDLDCTTVQFLNTGSGASIYGDLFIAGAISSPSLHGFFNPEYTFTGTNLKNDPERTFIVQVGNVNFFALDIIGTGGLETTTVKVTFPYPYKRPPMIFTNYQGKTDQGRDAYNYGFIGNITTTYAEISTYNKFTFNVLIIGEIA